MYKLITAPSVEPVSVSELKSQLRITSSAQDTMLGVLIKAARISVEEYLRYSIIDATWELYISSFPKSGEYLYIQKSPLTSITSLTYLDGSNVSRTLTENTDFKADYMSTPGRLYEAYGKTWPVALDAPNSIVVKFKAGYASAAATPDIIRQAILMRAATMYENPADEVTGTQVNEVLNNSLAMLAPLRSIRY